MLAPVFAVALGLAIAPTVGPGAWSVDGERSRVGFDLDATAHTVRGSTGALSGRLVARDRGDGAWALEGEIVVDAVSLDTGNARRDRKMREETLATSTHPRIVLRPESVRRIAGSPEDWELVGRLEVRGVERSISLRARIEPAPGGLAVTARFDVPLAGHRIPDPSFLFLRVGKSASAWVELVLVPAPAEAP